MKNFDSSFIRALYVPEVFIAVSTMLIAYLLTSHSGVGFYFCLPEILAIMGKPFLYSIPFSYLFVMLINRSKSNEALCKTVPRRNRFLECLTFNGATAAEVVSNLFLFGFILFSLVLFYTGISNIKPLIPLYNPSSFDSALLVIDTKMLLGLNWTTLMSQFHTPVLDQIMNVFYLSLFPMFSLLAIILFLQKDIVSMRILVLSMMLLAIMCNILHFLMPSLGDVYVNQETYKNIEDVYVTKIQGFLLYKMLEIINSPNTFQTAPFIGIAAFPSLHVANFTIYLLLTWNNSRHLFAFFLFVFLGLFFSTLYFGWHYIIDDVIGFILAGFVYIFVRKQICANVSKGEQIIFNS